MAASAVGSRELKTRLGAYLRRVREGRTFVVTDRGEPIAELRPLDRGTDIVSAKLARLRARGSLTRAHHRSLGAFKAIRASRGVSAAGLIAGGRDDRL